MWRRDDDGLEGAEVEVEVGTEVVR